MLILGILIFLVRDISRWNKGTPTIKPLETIKEYFRLNWLPMIGNILLAIAMLILAIKGEFDLLKLFNIPFGLSLTTALIIGVGCSALFKLFMGKVPEMMTTGEKIDTPK